MTCLTDPGFTDWDSKTCERAPLTSTSEAAIHPVVQTYLAILYRDRAQLLGITLTKMAQSMTLTWSFG